MVLASSIPALSSSTGLGLLFLQDVEDVAHHLGISISCSLEGETHTASRSKKLQIKKVVQEPPVVQKAPVVQKQASTFTSSSGLSILPVKKEMEMHEGEETLQETSTDGPRVNCRFCPKSFSKTGTLNRHIRKRHKDAVMPSKSFVNIKNNKLKTEGSEIDGSVNRYKCVKCEKSFLTGRKFSEHMRTHSVTGSGEHQCEVCQKRFPSSSSLILHRNIHLEEKPFKCDECDKGFAQKGNLKAHIQRYHDKEPSALLSENINTTLGGEAETMEGEPNLPEAAEDKVEVSESNNSDVIGEIVSEVLE